MSTVQICALISTIIAAALLYWTGYRGGLIDGRVEGEQDGKNIERAENAKTINELKASLQFIRVDHQHLAQRCKQLKASQTLSLTTTTTCWPSLKSSSSLPTLSTP